MQKQNRSGRTHEKPQIYTAICGGKDEPRTDITCFGEYSEFVSPVRNAKIYKILPHKFLDADITIWIDGNIELLIPPEQLVEEWLGDVDMALFKHPDRDCIYDEAPAAKGLFEAHLKVRDDIDKQIEHYREIDFPEHAGMGECNVIIRRNNPKVNAFNEAWWAEICRWSQRDQLSFPVTLAKHNLKVNFIKGNAREHKYFRYTPH